MNKTDFISYHAAQNDITKKQATVEVDRVLASIYSALKDGEDVNIVGFGKFEKRKRAARKGRNPQTGEIMDIPASAAVGFKPSSKLNEVVK